MNEMIKKPFANVAEPWALYDTVVLCSEAGMYGGEANVPGWFTTFAAFSGQETHSFFKTRTEGTVGLEYTNQQSADSMDFAFEAYSLGCSFFSPGCRVMGQLVEDATPEMVPGNVDVQSLHWWEVELPRHCAVQLKINQDIVAELPAYMAPPGYGPSGGGASFENDTFGRVSEAYMPTLNMSVTQGVPILPNRWRFPKKIGIPRTATIEVLLWVSEYARNVLSTVFGPFNYMFQRSPVLPDPPGPIYTEFPMRLGVQMSLLGKRMVQQRAQYHR